ncbi:hypothetical protein ABPG77_011202 [Micractinium sp. CCAP 211/92]
MAAAGQLEGAWGNLPFDAAAAVVATLTSLPSHQAQAAFTALRLTSRHWRHAADDALQRWTARAYLLADHNVPDSNEDGLVVLLRRFRNLRTLELDWARWQAPPRSLSAAALQALASLRRLETLTLCGCYPTAELFPAVAALPSLHSLVFEPYVGWSRGISFESRRAFAARPDVSVAPLARCTALASLELRNVDTAGVEADVAAVVAGASALRRLVLHRCIRATAGLAQQTFDVGCAASRLTCLGLRSSFTTDDAFQQLFAQLSRLQRLDISGSPNLTDDGFCGVTSLAGSLTALTMQGGHNVGPNGATALAQLSGLRELDLGYSNIMSGDYLLPLIAGHLTLLTLLDIRGCHRACAPHAFDHVSRLAQLQHLRQALCARSCRLGPAAVRALSHLHSLRHLDIADNPLLGSLEALASLRELQFLDSSECELEDAHVEALLASLPAVRTVLLDSNSSLTTAALEALAAGPARCTLEVLQATELASLDCEELPHLLPQLAALQVLDVSGAMCDGGSLVDGEALLAAAEAAPALHTLM